VENWDFAGWGKANRINDLGSGPIARRELGVPVERTHRLGVWQATAICGNDITSSCLYVSALTIVAAGAFAPLALAMVAAVLFLFRRIYGEVGSALPMNGGTYTVLLNTTNKKLAAGAAVLTLLSYVATAVISAGEAIHYVHALVPVMPVQLATLGLLGLFAILNLVGITESATVAVGIFILHMATLTVLSIGGLVTVLQDPAILVANFQFPMPTGENLLHTLFIGFAAGMLGISGFESSANFIEEQAPGVFRKTLRNMWLAVALFNPLICVLALGLVPRGDVPAFDTSLLAEMGNRSLGSWFQLTVGIDAALVLSGAVLTSFVGVTGLARRMSLDRCLPQFFLQENRWRRTNHWIILGFFAVCSGILLATRGNIGLLAGVYTLSFLGVMILFAIGNILLKRRRSKLPREERASWPGVIVGLLAVVVGLIGNLTVDNLRIFGLFLAGMGGFVAVMFLRVQLLRLALFVFGSVVERLRALNDRLHQGIHKKIGEINSRGAVYFTRGDDIADLNRAALYVLQNEQTDNLLVVHAFEREEDIPADLSTQLTTIDHMYPQLRVDFLAVKGTFGPDLIERLSQRLKVPKNYMFIGTPGDRFPHKLPALGGVRLII
jgi:amino acid transporter